MADGASSAEDSRDDDSNLGRTHTATGHRKRSPSQTAAQREEQLAVERLQHIPFFITSSYYTVLVTRNFTKSADCPRRKSTVFPRHCRGYLRNHARVSAESNKGVRGIVQGCPRNRARVSAES